MSDKYLHQKLTRRQLLSMASKGAALMGLASVATACGGAGDQPDAPAEPEAEAPAQEAEAPARDTVTIQFITPGALGLERTMYENFVYRFMDANPHIRVNISFEAWDDYMTKLPTMLAGGVVPDVIHQHISIVQDYGQRGALLDLAPYMQQDGVNPEDYVPALFNAFSHEGKTFGIPKDSAAWGVYYNKNKFDEAGLDYPSDDWTLDEFRTLAEELTRDQEGRPASDPNFDRNNITQWGFSWMQPDPTQSENARGFVRAAGGDWYDEAYSETLITDEPVLEHFRMFHEMRCVTNSTPTPAQALGQGDPFRTGLTAMTVGFHTVDFFSREENVDFDYDVTFMPAGPGGQFVPVGCSGWAIPAQAQHQEEAWEFVKYLTSLEVQQYIGEQKRWGVSLAEAVDAIIPEDTPAENFARVHVDPLRGQSDREVIAFKFPANQSRIREIYATHFDPIWTCASDDIESAAERAKAEIDQVLQG